MAKSDEPRKVKTTVTVFRIINYLCQQQGARVTEVASELGIAKSTAHRHLSTLQQEEYVVKYGDQYLLSLRFLYFGIQTRKRKPAYELVDEKVRDLAQTTGERVQFVLEEHGKGVWIYRESGENAVQTNTEVGKYIPIHMSAAGKAILAYLPEERVKWILEEHGLESLTKNTITDRDALFEELKTIRERGYAINRQEQIVGLRAMGVPVLNQDNQVLGALSVSGPTNRMKGEWFHEELPDLLLGTANELELNIMHL